LAGWCELMGVELAGVQRIPVRGGSSRSMVFWADHLVGLLWSRLFGSFARKKDGTAMTTASRSNSTAAVALAATLCAVLVGCAAQTRPTAAPAQTQLQGLPASVVDVQVNDLRVPPEPDTVPRVLKAQLVSALSAQPAPADASRYRLDVDVIEHRAFFTLGDWNASTRLRARLTELSGKPLGQWDASGTARRSNMLGSAGAEAVAQDSYDLAVADLLSSLSTVSVRQ